MYYYRLYGMKIATDMEFSQLVVCNDEQKIDIEICNGVIPENVLNHKEEQRWDFGDEISWLENKTCYLVVENGKKLTYRLKPDGNRGLLQSFILGFGMSMLAMQRGILAIHCSALADEQGALLIAGESGAGKSTLTSAFMEKGYRLLADDMVWVEITEEQQIRVWPAFPFQKLCRNVALEKGYNLDELLYINEDKDKFLVPYQGEFKTEYVPLKGFLMLMIVRGEEVLCQKAEGLTKFHICANNLFLRHLLQAEKYDPKIGQKCLKMAAGIPIYCIGRPEGKDTTKQVIEQAIATVETMN